MSWFAHVPPPRSTSSRVRATTSAWRSSGSSGSSMSRISYAVNVPEPPSLGLRRPRRQAPLGNGRRESWQVEGAVCYETMARPLTLLSGAVAGFGLYRLLARRRPVPAHQAPPTPEPRAEELRRKLAEARTMVEEREEFESAETPVDRAEPAPEVDERRKRVHAEGRRTAERMRRKPGRT